MKCLYCGRFCADVLASVNGFDQITKVEGVCRRCGKVDLTDADWCYEEFFPEPMAKEMRK